MAEQEVIKHTKKIYKTWFSKEHSFFHKLGEFLIEIFIIVFAVSLSVWFHNRSDYTHQQEDVRLFLQGLKADLGHDIMEMQEDKDSYLNQKFIFSYIAGIKLKDLPSRDTIVKYRSWIFNTTQLNPNDGRFEGFKSSGKIGTIENKELQNDIMDLYQENIPALLSSTRGYISSKQKFFDYFVKNYKRLTDSTGNMISMLKNDEMLNIASSLSSPQEILDRYAACILLMNKIISEIDKEYH